GGDLPELRTGNTLDALSRLEATGCLTTQERNLLEKDYVFLRDIEHHLQIMFDLQTHDLPVDEVELSKLALRMGFENSEDLTALEKFRAAYQETTEINRTVLDHLLHDAFPDEPDEDPAVDLVLDPEPPEEFVQAVLGGYGFQDAMQAYENLTALGREQIPFLSTRRCRHFLASISPKLLQAISATPDPDSTLVDLSRISDSLGGKGVLWEMFSFSEASLRLYVRLCAACPYLSSMLTSNPGMIDELTDSLLLDRLPTRKYIQESLAHLCRGAEDVEPILHSFKNSNHLRVGVRDILGKEDIRSTTAALADIAETILQHVTYHEYGRLVAKYGVPGSDAPGGRTESTTEVKTGNELADASQAEPTSDSQRYAQLPPVPGLSELVILGMGKLGGREPNYHSDLDIIFLYQGDGKTHHADRRRGGETTTNQHFFSELGQRVIRYMNRLGPYGRLFEVDARLRPTGRSGALAVSLDEFVRYFQHGRGELWERQALCKARPVFGSRAARYEVMREVRAAINRPGWADNNAEEIRHMRMRMEETAGPYNLKRGPGGTVDIEFAVQMLQLRHARQRPEILVPGTLAAIDAMRDGHLFDRDDAEYFDESYRFLRSVEARLRLMNTTARHDLPQDGADLSKLAYLLEVTESELLERCRHITSENRRRFNRLFERVS
ncbi:MAG: hypothetical protein KDA60_11445, partial [Planctomycetales bacterium]|nr:hypothetical protein [Planctomycetales bacterium]